MSELCPQPEVIQRSSFARLSFLRYASAVVLSAIALAGCGGGSGSVESDKVGGQDTTSEIVPETTLETAPEAADEFTDELPSGILSQTYSPAECAGDDVCFDRTGMMQAYERTISYVKPFFDETYQDPPQPNNFMYISDEVGYAQTDCGQLDSANTAAFCGLNNTVYFGQGMMWAIYSEKGGGDAGLALAFAHEYGHFLQNVFGVPTPNTTRESIPHENQADCVAGAWASWLYKKGQFSVNDGQEILNTLAFIADTEREGRNHGFDRERQEAVEIGMKHGLEGCNDFYSQTPLILR